MSDIWNVFDEKICLTLKSTPERRRSAVEEAKKVGLNNFKFFYGSTPRDERVKNAFRKNKVFEYPNCWRCNRPMCGCENNILTPEQIACFVSYQRIFESAVKSNSNIFLVFEDDIEFETYAQEVGTKIFNREYFDYLKFYENLPVLFSLGQGYFGKGAKEKRGYNGGNIRIADGDLSECNVLFAFNKTFAKLALTLLDTYTMTSDIYIHNFLGQRCIHWSLFPRIAHDKSWSTGDFQSQIHPKEVFANNKNVPQHLRDDEKRRLKTHIKRVESAQQYKEYIDRYLNN